MYVPNDCSFLSEISTAAKLDSLFGNKELSGDDTTINLLLSPQGVFFISEYFIEVWGVGAGLV